ncbi:hypothetical protein BLNAU_12868 [Blattamonas nauphoetae]|uniref:Uncharacterized protein n=1 Tax=Blattamonas nauphoetae TaxID=2049346 RepID=A0ABQ9XPY4_9EUKA|nr:hypothetical protein BLNAU_12868 [Blattamonas nauphoetae]
MSTSSQLHSPTLISRSRINKSELSSPSRVLSSNSDVIRRDGEEKFLKVQHSAAEGGVDKPWCDDGTQHPQYLRRLTRKEGEAAQEGQERHTRTVNAMINRVTVGFVVRNGERAKNGSLPVDGRFGTVWAAESRNEHRKEEEQVTTA